MSSVITAALIGKLAGVISLSAYFFYIYAIVRGTTKPNKATWWILTLVGSMIAASYFASGGRNAIWIAISYVVGPLLVAILSLRYGEGGWSKLDKVCLAGTVVSFFVWIFLNSPFLALLVNIFIDFLGLLPTVKKSYLRPWTEDRFAWTLTVAACVLNLFALENWGPEISLYPIYLVVINGIVAIFLFRKKYYQPNL